MYSTVQSVVFSLLLPPSLESEQWSQQSTSIFFFFYLLTLSNLPYPKPCVYEAAPCWSRWKASVHTVTRDTQQHLCCKLCYAGWRDKSKNSGEESIGFILVSWCWYGCQCSLEFVHIRKCDLYKFLLILSLWQWLIVFSSQNVNVWVLAQSRLFIRTGRPVFLSLAKIRKNILFSEVQAQSCMVFSWLTSFQSLR